MSIADEIRNSEDPYREAVCKMVYREAQTYQVVFHFEDESTLTFRKEYHLEQ